MSVAAASSRGRGGGGRWRAAGFGLGRWLLRLGVTAGLAYGGLLAARSVHAYATTSSRFEARSLVYDPSPHVSDDRLRELLQLRPGTNILSLDLLALGEQIAAHPWVAEASVVRRLPDTLEVRVREHRAAAVVLAGRFYLASDNGHLFKEVERGERGHLPVITGISRALIVDDRAEAETEVVRALDIVATYQQVSRPRLGEVNLGASGDVTLYTAQAGTQLLLGRADLATKLRRYDVLRSVDGVRAERLASVYLDGSTARGRRHRVAARFFSPEDEVGVFFDSLRASADEGAAEISPTSPKKRSNKRRIPRHH
ncbi:MAG: FtsQ-type POTRA domain-containing protein [Nannocystaceae bacterium]